MSILVGGALVAIINLVFMVAELMAGRLAAPWIGLSAYTWVALVSVALAGCACGNALADALNRRLCPWRVAALGCVLGGLGLFFMNEINGWSGHLLEAWSVSVPLRAAVHMAGLFALPALCMGLGTPSVLAAAVGDDRSGRGIGIIYACGMSGCVVGSLLAGLVLPETMGTDTVFRCAGGVLALAGAVCFAGATSSRLPHAGVGGVPWRASGRLPAHLDVPPATAASGRQAAAARRVHEALVFGVGFLALAVEMAIAKQVAPITGASHVVWSILFAVFIGGMGAGGWWGGWLADHADWRKWNALVFLLAGLAVYPFAPAMNAYVGLDMTVLLRLPSNLRLPLHFMLAFLPCAFLLGAATTVAVRDALQKPDGGFDRGHAGRYWALAALGNVAGTVVAGFILVGCVRSAVLLVFCAAALVGYAALLAWSTPQAPQALSRWLAVIALGLCGVGLDGLSFGAAESPPAWIQPRNTTLADGASVLLDRESRYNRVIVYGDKPDARMLTLGLDRTPHSSVDVYDPTRLYATYVQMLAGGVDAVFPGHGALDALVLGGGGFVLPRYLAATRPDSRILVAEIDPVVTEAARTLLGLGRAAGVTVIDQDGRNVVNQLVRSSDGPVAGGRRFDIVVGDTIADTAVPYHLMTDAFNSQIAQLLKPGGVYLLHLLDRPDRGLLVGSAVRTLRVTFRHVLVVRWAGVQDVRGSHILLASDRELDGAAVLRAIRSAHPDFDGSCLAANEVEALCDRPGTVIMRDRFVPVEKFVLRDILDNDVLLRSNRARDLMALAARDPECAYEGSAKIVRSQTRPLPDELVVLRTAAAQAGRMAEACALLGDKARIPTGDDHAKIAHAEILQELKREDEAGGAFEVLARRHPHEVSFWLQAATGYWYGKRRDEAVRVLRAGMAVEPRPALSDLLQRIESGEELPAGR